MWDCAEGTHRFSVSHRAMCTFSKVRHSPCYVLCFPCGQQVLQLLCGGRACPAHQYMSQSCQPTADRQCSDLTQCRTCDGTLTEQEVTPSAEDCMPEQETIRPTATTDRLCAPVVGGLTPPPTNSTNNATLLARASTDDSPAWYAWMLIAIGALLLCCLLCVCCLGLCKRHEKRDEVYFHPQSHKHLQVKSTIRAARPLTTWDGANTYDLEPLQWSTREHEIKELTKQARRQAITASSPAGFTTPVKRRSVVNYGVVLSGQPSTSAASAQSRKVPAPLSGQAYPSMFPEHGQVISGGVFLRSALLISTQ